MIEVLRTFLYPLGFVANLLFAARFFVQWIQSEKRKESFVSKIFWRISFLANLCMCLHGYIQVQYPICMIQSLNAIIAWRNLNLMSQKIYRLKTTLWMMVVCVFFLTCLFVLQSNNEWMRPPTLPWSGSHTTSSVPLTIHVLGFFAMFLFASRYWIQWWFAEKHRKSFVGRSFWWISCIGAIFSLGYAVRLKDPVNILGFSVGLIPYIRNLMLFKKKQSHQKSLFYQLKTPPNPSTSNAIFIFAGEQSGDFLGAQLIDSLKKIFPSVIHYGVGGNEMQKAGLKIIQPMERFQVMGFSDVVKSFPRLYMDFRKIRNEILRLQPLAVVLIDYPDFNMRLAKSLRKHGFGGKIIHYVCPSVWAWRKKRVHGLVNTLDQLLTILPFEKKIFEKTPLKVSYVGHPLVTAIDSYSYDTSWKTHQPLVAIFPGSRKGEIEHNLPLQLNVAKQLRPHYSIAVSVARPNLRPLIQKYVDASMLLVESDKRYELMRASNCAIATSGTIVLELGLHHLPTVITYQLSSFNYLLGRYFFKILLPHYTLVNIICNKEVFPEFIHKDLKCDVILQAVKRLLDNPEPCINECKRLRELLSSQDASLKAAHAIAETIQ